ncbi:MFS transporter [Polynucleobacter necessarius]|uniref:MFS transporter n=1 Tax=Polynucleobacter necessarius TaxID=576610 RepID=UPI001E5D288E|nr:MFS transporter [Polynucleobacter necessarius]
MGLRGLVATGKSSHERTHGFSILNAGIFAGMNCGAVIGALLAQRIGFSYVMILASLMITVALPFTFLLTVNSKPTITGNDKLTLAGLRDFFLHKDTFFFFLLITIPSAITTSFLTYFFPVFSSSLDVNQGDIGRGFLLYGICMVFIGPLLMKFFAHKKVNAKHLMLASCLVGVLSLTTFWSFPTFVGALIAIVILGISDSVGLVSQNGYFMSIPATEKIGHSNALSFYSAMKKAGQFSGPAVFGVAVSLGTLVGVGLIASTYLITTISFGLISNKARREAKLFNDLD